MENQITIATAKALYRDIRVAAIRMAKLFYPKAKVIEEKFDCKGVGRFVFETPDETCDQFYLDLNLKGETMAPTTVVETLGIENADKIKDFFIKEAFLHQKLRERQKMVTALFNNALNEVHRGLRERTDDDDYLQVYNKLRFEVSEPQFELSEMFGMTGIKTYMGNENIELLISELSAVVENKISDESEVTLKFPIDNMYNMQCLRALKLEPWNLYK